ncbi:MAG: quinol oxidase [Rhodospirillaceae bacterium]|nr:quinol oxidase [Rhodospirillales bacterium]
MADTDRWGAMALLAATLVLLGAWPVWRMVETVPTDAYAQAPELFIQGAETYAAAHKIGERDGMPLVQPPPGSEIPVIARRFEFWPALELQAGQSYRIHVASTDTVHTVVVDGREYSLIPGQVRVVEVTPASKKTIVIQCGEYCGLGHNRMRGTVTIAESMH